MRTSIEIKAHVIDLEKTFKTLQRIATSEIIAVSQIDTYFKCSISRFKLREQDNGAHELLLYKRNRDEGPNKGESLITPVTDPSTMKEVLTKTNGIAGVITKERVVGMIGTTRIHLDHLHELGNFIEVSFQIENDQVPLSFHFDFAMLIANLGIDNQHTIQDDYFDMLGDHRKSFQ